MTVTVKHMMEVMEVIAPAKFAESWDNVGLHMGHPDWQVQTIWVALDPTPQVIKEACHNQVNMLITHHPFFFKPIQAIQLNKPQGELINRALTHRLAIFCAHTNLDSVNDGLNDLMAKKIGFTPTRALKTTHSNELYKLVFYVPKSHEKTVLNALCETPAGTIGHYHSCSFRHEGIGSYIPDSQAKPFIGKTWDLTHVDEIRVETVIQKQHISKTLSIIQNVHPYETMAYDIYPLYSFDNQCIGLGRVGKLSESLSLLELAQQVKKQFNCSNIRCIGNPDMKIQTIAICSGSGASLIPEFLSSGADVYITGDLKYHDAQNIEDNKRACLDIGHFSSERIMVDFVVNQLRTACTKNQWRININACPDLLEKDPFITI